MLGATGAMAVYLIPKLLDMGYEVDGVSLEDVKSNKSGLTYIQADAMDLSFLKEQLKNGYDAIVDFMIYYSVEMFSEYYKLFLDNTKHYIFFSSYRVYADDSPLAETSKRLLDVDKPATMTWAGDVADMLAAIILNEKAFGQTYNVATSEHMTWESGCKNIRGYRRLEVYRCR